jgi:hypothetical protein
MSYFTAQTVRINGDIWLINSPSTGKPGPTAFYHESLHHVIDPVIDDFPELVREVEPLFNVAMERAKLGYNDWGSIVKESFVRTVDRVLQGKHFGYSKEKIYEMVNEEYRLGFILVPAVYAGLQKYEISEESLQSFIPKILSSINVKDETQNWENLWKNY